jgi:hypothetical protein
MDGWVTDMKDDGLINCCISKRGIEEGVKQTFMPGVETSSSNR